MSSSNSTDEIATLQDITRKQYIQEEYVPQLAEDLRCLYPGISFVEIKRKIVENDWKITSNDNDDDNDSEEYV